MKHIINFVLIFNLAIPLGFSEEQLNFDEKNKNMAEQLCGGDVFNGDCNQDEQTGGEKSLPYLSMAFNMITMGLLNFANFAKLFSKGAVDVAADATAKKATAEASKKAADAAAKKAASTAARESINQSRELVSDSVTQAATDAAEESTKAATQAATDAAASEAAAQKAKGAKQSQTLTKICDIAMTVANMGVGLIQSGRENDIEQKFKRAPRKSIHAEGFYSHARLNEGKRKDHKTQKTIFVSGAVCYGVAMALAIWPQFNFQEAAQAGIRVALSSALSIAYNKQEKGRAKLRDASLSAASQLGIKTVCQQNSNCTCSPSMKDHPDYANFCLDINFASNSEGNESTCIDASGKIDKQCQCRKTNTCFNSRIQTFISSLDDGVVPAHIKKKLYKDISDISEGTYSKTDASYVRDQKFANKQTKKFNSLLKKSTDVKSASSFNQAKAAGIPNNIASLLSQINPDNAKKENLTNSSFRKSNNYRIGSRSRSLSSSKKSNNSNPFSSYLNSMKKQAPSKGGVNLTREIAQNITSKAAIRSSSSQIFSTISARYQKSSYRLE